MHHDSQNNGSRQARQRSLGRFAPNACRVLGMAGIAANGGSLDEIFTAMLEARSGIEPASGPGGFPRAMVHQTVLDLLPNIDGLGPCEKTFRLSLACAKRAMAQAGESAAWRPRQVGLVLSSAKGEMEDFLAAAAGRASRGHFLLGKLARDLAVELNLAGPVQAVSNACASGLVALAQAGRLLAGGRAKAVLVLGADTMSGFVEEGFASLRALSPLPCRPFDRQRQGLNLGEGAAALLLDTASSDEVSPLAYLNGWSVGNDANHMTGPSREGSGLSRVMSETLARAGLAPQAVGLVNAHGTGTEYNDEMEGKAIQTIFGDLRPNVVSFKGYLGHTLGAAGVLEAALCIEALRRRVSPASLGCGDLGISSPLTVPRQNTPLPGLRAVMTLKSGFGGVNAAAVFTRQAHHDS